jgi:hypothetical protein
MSDIITDQFIDTMHNWLLDFGYKDGDPVFHDEKGYYIFKGGQMKRLPAMYERYYQLNSK